MQCWFREHAIRDDADYVAHMDYVHFNPVKNGLVTSPADWPYSIFRSNSGIDEQLKREILGARRRILFVEGTDSSLDSPLYRLLFPDVSVIAKGTCRSVEDAVTSLRGAEGLHWIRALGLIDNDRRSPSELDRLNEKGIHASEHYAVESVYYHPEIQRRVAERLVAASGGDDAATRVDRACAAAISAIRNDSVPHLSRHSPDDSQTRSRW